ncbi:MAG: helix-turn-helix domain-containing protein [Methylocystaceae bacterium]
MEANNESEKKPSGGMSIAAAIVIAAIIFFIGLHQVSSSLDTIATSLNNQAGEQNHIANNLLAKNNYPDILDLNQAATYLGITSEQIVYLASPLSGFNLPVLKVDDQYRFSRAALDEWMKTPHRME